MHPVKDEDIGLREKKRITTRRKIVESALDLVENQGFDNVTVEQICSQAEISRRTFFNYMESKEEAVTGTFPFAFREGAMEFIATTESDNIVDLVLSQLVITFNSVDPDFLRRRRVIVFENPALHYAVSRQKYDLLSTLGSALAKHFETFPHDRVLPDLPVQVEINVAIEIARASVTMYMSNPHFPASGGPDVDHVRLAARAFTDFAKEMTWQKH
ncbi:HTH-type dhaKLM operon transcriptional activator DhaS [Corynebacterium capitovis DSM 44611]|nr:HTH-type dhaKLM operon transcriptional activator DhaS [Corynebacterium capitovis DSM 44611]